MTQNPLVSVIIPNYCHAQFLDQRITSVLNQTYTNFEVIILDDCSPDNGASKTVIENYRDNPHVTHIVYNETNSGSTFKQWNLGFSLAKGELIWIAESDDYCELTMLEKLVFEFNNNSNLVLAYSPSIKVDINGKNITPWNIHFRRFVRLNGQEYVRRYLSISNHCNNASAAVFKKNIAIKIDTGYTTMVAGGDYLFWVEIAECGDVAIVNEKLNYFRQHNNKVTPQKTKDGINAKEAYKTFCYIVSHFSISNRRKQFMIDTELYNLSKQTFSNTNIRQELVHLWGDGRAITFFRGILVKTNEILRHRINLYI